MTKPKVFIGSSSEHRDLALSIQMALQYDAAPFVWTQGTFLPSQFTLESLEGALDISDFAVLVCAPDDITETRGEKHSTVRDNVIFELGLFIGRIGRNRTFLVSPRGIPIHLPSDLNGLTPETYDPDQLGNPSAAVGPACTNIISIIRKSGPIDRPSNALTEVSSGAEKNADADQNAVEAHFTPSNDWSHREYEKAAFMAIATGRDLEHLEKAFSNYASALGEQAHVRVAEWEAWNEYCKIIFSKGGKVAAIRKLSEASPSNVRIKQLLGRALAHYDDPRGAARELVEVIKSAKEIKLIVSSIRDIASLPSEFFDQELAIDFRNSLSGCQITNHEDEINLATGMRLIAEAARFTGISNTILEVLSQLEPDNTNTRFDLAVNYSNEKLFDISILHYEAIPYSERSGTVWNNLGVSYHHAQMKGKAVTAYFKASELGATIADGNIANRLISAGFFEQARSRAEKAISEDGEHHETVVSALANLEAVQHDENEAHIAAKVSARALQSELLDIGKAALSNNGYDIIGEWVTADGELWIAQDLDGDYLITGEVVKETLARGLGLGGLYGLPKNRTVKQKITGKLRRFGDALEGTIKNEGEEGVTGLLGIGGRERRLLSRVDDSRSEIRGIEQGYSREPFVWRRPPKSLS